MSARLLWGAIALVFFTTPSAAQTILGEFAKWVAFAEKKGKSKLCVAAAEPSKSAYSPPIKSRSTALFFLSRFPAQDVRTEPSASFGYPVAAGAKVVVQIDGDATFTMFADQDTAWVPGGEDAALIDAMRKGDEMVVRGQSRRGTITTDTYSLDGVTAAVNAITKECP